jgi:membrane protease YdiL (CAAX protease family)
MTHLRALSKQHPIISVLIIAWFFSAIFLAIAGQLVLLGLALISVSYLLLFAWLTVRLTHPMPEEPTGQKPDPWRIGTQTALLMLVIVITGLSSFGTRFPVWSVSVDWVYTLGERLLPVEWVGGPGNALANPLQYFIIPLALLLILGARPSELGFKRGHRSWVIAAVWSALPVLTWLVVVPMGLLPLPLLLRWLIGNTLQNGFFEEFLFRGALFTRLKLVLRVEAALVLQAFIFGLWHLGANIQLMNGDVVAGLAFCIVNQSVTGLVYGIVFIRTRNLLAPSVAHVMTNVFGQAFG